MNARLLFGFVFLISYFAQAGNRWGLPQVTGSSLLEGAALNYHLSPGEWEKIADPQYYRARRANSLVLAYEGDWGYIPAEGDGAALSGLGHGLRLGTTADFGFLGSWAPLRIMARVQPLRSGSPEITGNGEVNADGKTSYQFADSRYTLAMGRWSEDWDLGWQLFGDWQSAFGSRAAQFDAEDPGDTDLAKLRYDYTEFDKSAPTSWGLELAGDWDGLRWNGVLAHRIYGGNNHFEVTTGDESESVETNGGYGRLGSRLETDNLREGNLASDGFSWNEPGIFANSGHEAARLQTLALAWNGFTKVDWTTKKDRFGWRLGWEIPLSVADYELLVVNPGRDEDYQANLNQKASGLGASNWHIYYLTPNSDLTGFLSGSTLWWGFDTGFDYYHITLTKSPAFQGDHRAIIPAYGWGPLYGDFYIYRNRIFRQRVRWSFFLPLIITWPFMDGGQLVTGFKPGYHAEFRREKNSLVVNSADDADDPDSIDRTREKALRQDITLGLTLGLEAELTSELVLALSAEAGTVRSWELEYLQNEATFDFHFREFQVAIRYRLDPAPKSRRRIRRR